MVTHIDMALDMLGQNSKTKGANETDKYNAMLDIFIHGLNYDILADKYNCAARTISRWRNDMIVALGPLLFGVDGLLSDMA